MCSVVLCRTATDIVTVIQHGVSIFIISKHCYVTLTVSPWHLQWSRHCVIFETAIAPGRKSIMLCNISYHKHSLSSHHICLNTVISLIKDTGEIYLIRDDAIKWKHLPRYCPFVRGIHRSTVNSPHKGQWGGAMMFSLISACMNAWVNNGEAGDLRRHRTHYDVIVMTNCMSAVRLNDPFKDVRFALIIIVQLHCVSALLIQMHDHIDKSIYIKS